MNTTTALEKAILAIEGAIDDLHNKQEINVSDLQSTLYEIRGSLWQETNGDSIVFPTHSVSLFDKDYYFRWPKGEDAIQSFYIEDGLIYASSAMSMDIEVDIEVDKAAFVIPDYATSVSIGAWSQRQLLFVLPVKKTNLRNCANTHKKAA